MEAPLDPTPELTYEAPAIESIDDIEGLLGPKNS